MHHLIYPDQDTYITNDPLLGNKNFGITELLKIGTTNTVVEALSPTKNYSYSNIVFNNQGVSYFTGNFTGSFLGTVVNSNGSISGSNLSFSASYFSGSIDGTGSIGSGSFGNIASGSNIIGFISGSIIAPISLGLFTGIISGSSACLFGTGSGIDTQNQPNWQNTNILYINRSLLQFDLTNISESISNGTIINPYFSLKLKTCNDYQLPIEYTIYALPISQSWNMGNGYASDGGSSQGANWWFLDNNGETPWYSVFISSSRPPIDFIHNPTFITASFGFGGGTFWTSSWCSQSFNYNSSDINMDITPMVMGWISGSIPNNGLILISSDELNPTGSGFTLTFFSRDTNTIYSPCLDVKWNDLLTIDSSGSSSIAFITGSIYTSSISFSTASSGLSMTIESGSYIISGGGVSGFFSASAFINTTNNYITTSNQTFNGSNPTFYFTGSFDGSFSGSASYIIGNLSGSTGYDFTVDYFSGSVDGSTMEVNYSEITGTIIVGLLSGSFSTSFSTGIFTGIITSSIINLNGVGGGNYLDVNNMAFSGFLSGMGLAEPNPLFAYDPINTGSIPCQFTQLNNINNISVFGFAQGIISSYKYPVSGPCGIGFCTQYASASFINGPFMGSNFTAYYADYAFQNAYLTGAWSPLALYGASITLPIPSGIDPYAYATISGSFINGVALGLYNLYNNSSASFVGQFINGNLLGSSIYLQLSGSAYTSSFVYTSSVQFSSSVLNQIDTERPFSITLQNVKQTYKFGDIPKFGIFPRIQYPLKTFGITTQQSQYLIPDYLPSSSYYSVIDNQTGEVIIDFDQFTQIGCSYPEGNFFFLDTTSFQPDRYYKILIKVMDNQSIYTFDTEKTFKIVR